MYPTKNYTQNCHKLKLFLATNTVWLKRLEGVMLPILNHWQLFIMTLWFPGLKVYNFLRCLLACWPSIYVRNCLSIYYSLDLRYCYLVVWPNVVWQIKSLNSRVYAFSIYLYAVRFLIFFLLFDFCKDFPWKWFENENKNCYFVCF